MIYFSKSKQTQIMNKILFSGNITEEKIKLLRLET